MLTTKPDYGGNAKKQVVSSNACVLFAKVNGCASTEFDNMHGLGRSTPMSFQQFLDPVGTIAPVLRRIALLAVLASAGLFPNAAFGQQKPDVAGEYAGLLGPLHVKLHLSVAPNGAISGTVDSPDQNMFGLPCADFHLNGQALSFTVPMVSGTWTGLLSGDGSSLSGVWSQGSPTPLNLTRVTTATAMSTATSNPTPPQAPNSEVKWDDYTFKFDRSGTMAQVFQGGKVVGTILTMNGQQRVIPLPGTDSAKLTKSFEDYIAFSARSHSGNSSAAVVPTTPLSAEQPSAPSATTSPTSPTNGSGTTVPAIRFDEATHSITVPRPDGLTVTFVGEDVKIAGFRRRNYIVRHQKGTVGRFMESNASHSSRAGGSVSGGGEEFLLEGGGIIYDSGMGGYNLQENPQVLLAKQLSKIAVDAVADVRQVPGHENFAPPGYNNLKEISQYRLRSDGSR
jgi:hypothetical protein